MWSPTFTFLSLTFHVYGLILGLALVSWYLIFQSQAQFYKVDTITRQLAAVILLLGALVGARLWHVATAWSLYAHQLNQIFYLWQGGLSILGAVMGGVGLLMIASLFNRSLFTKLNRLLAACALALPLAQAIGRLGNYVNQELYGYPTQLPWGIAIDTSHRLPQFALSSKFQPLFAYEILALIGLFGILKMLSTKSFWQKKPARLFGLYLFMYSGIRFGLDFMRPDKTFWTNWPIGINQVICLIVLCLSGLWLVTQFYQHRQVI